MPELHLHALSPEEIKYGAALRRVPIRAYLEELVDALVVFVDIAVDNAQLQALDEVASHIILLDHHVSAA